MKPLRVLVCIDSLNGGGAQRQTVALLRGLDRTRFSPRVVSLHGPRMGLSRQFVPDLQAADIRVVELDRRWRWADLPGSVWALQKARREFQPDLIHSISHHCNHLTRALRLLPGPRFRLLTAIRTEYNARQLRNERWEQRWSDAIVCNSPSMAGLLRTQARVPEARLHHIANGLEVDRFSRSPDPGLRDRLAPGRRRLVVMMARITEQKAPELLAEAVGLLRVRDRLPRDVEFWIVGEPDSPATLARLSDAIRRHRLEQVIRVLPPTNQPAAPLHASDFTVLFSLWEGTPNAVLESLAAGRPAVVSAAANAGGVIREGAQGWVVPTADIPALADRLDQVLSLDDATLQAMAPACRARAAEFDLPTMVQRYEALYQALCGPDRSVT